MTTHRWSRPYLTPREAVTDFLHFSPPARALLETHPEWKEWLLRPEIVNPLLRRSSANWEEAWRHALGSAQPEFAPGLSALRTLKQRESLRLGLLDFGGFPVLEEVMAQLSDLADFCLEKVLHLVRTDLDKNEGAPGPPFTVIALDRLGSRELGYGPELAILLIQGEADELAVMSGTLLSSQAFFHPLAERFQAAFGAVDPPGDFYRIHLGPRPAGPDGTPVLSLESYENRYAAWENPEERLMLLPARYVAGSIGLGGAFLRLRKTFSYPGHLTQEILREIAALKQRVEQEVQPAQKREHPVQRGAGVLRKIEFIVHVFQLLHGASHHDLQQTGTLAALAALRVSSLLPAEQVHALEAAYRFWRYVEHRYQLRGELPSGIDREESVREIAECLGFCLPDFKQKLEQHRRAVDTIFSEVFTLPAPSALPSYPLDFLPDPVQARKDLARLLPEQLDGSSDPRTRQALTHLWPALRSGLRGSLDPHATLTRLSEFVTAYGSRTFLYESLATNPKAVQLLLAVFDHSAYFSALLHDQPDLFEEIAGSPTLHEPKTRASYGKELHSLGAGPAGPVRSYVRIETLRLFLREVLQLASALEREEEFSSLAEACLELALTQAEPSSPLALIGLGRLGGRDLGYGSRLKILLLGEEAEAAQRVVDFMKERVSRGLLFPLDFSFRSPGKSPLDFPFPTDVNDSLSEAQLEEIQALNRARFVAGDFSVAAPFLDGVNRIWRKAGALAQTAGGIEARRDRLERERIDASFPSSDFQTGPGGLIEIEFGLHKFLLARGHREPNLLTALDWMKRVHPVKAETWREGLRFLRRVETVLRRDTCMDVTTLPRSPEELKHLAGRLGFPSASDFLSHYQEQTGRIRAVYEAFRHRPI